MTRAVAGRSFPLVPPRLFVSLAVALASLAAVERARAQEAKPDAPKAEKPSAAKDEKRPAPVQNDVVECTTLATSLATLDFGDALATPDGKRTQFEPIPKGVAFECWLEGMPPRKCKVEEPDPARPGATHGVDQPCVAFLRVHDEEWDGYYQFLRKDTPAVRGPGDEAVFLYAVLTGVLDQKTTLLWRRDLIADAEKRARDALDLLKKGQPFVDVVHGLSEDDTTRQADGLFAHDSRGSAFDRYPLSKVFFELGENQIAGPILTRNAAYVVHIDQFEKAPNQWYDKVRASAVTFRYSLAQPATADQIARSKQALRVRTDEDRFKRMLPPTIQVPPPKQFGPDDVAPLGKPDVPLKERSIEDARDGKPYGG